MVAAVKGRRDAVPGFIRRNDAAFGERYMLRGRTAPGKLERENEKETGDWTREMRKWKGTEEYQEYSRHAKVNKQWYIKK